MKFFSSYSSGLFCSPEPFTFVSLLPLSLSLEATCLFYHFYAFLSTPFFAFCFFLHFISLFLSLFVHFALLLCSFHTKSDNCASLSCHFGLFIILRQKINSQNRSSVSHWRRHPDLNWGSRCCRPMPYHLAIAPYWSGLRGSNSLPPPWQGGALPDELNPHLVVSTILYARYRNLIHKECIGDRNGARTHDL